MNMTQQLILESAYRCIHFAWEDFQDEGIGIELSSGGKDSVSGLAYGPVLRATITRRLFIAAAEEGLSVDLLPNRNGIIVRFTPTLYLKEAITEYVVHEYRVWKKQQGN